MTTIAEAQPVAQPITQVVVGGVDTHADTHTAAVLDTAGRALGNAQFPATPAGYQQLTDWLSGHGTLQSVGVEGTGADGAGLARHLSAAGVQVVEVDRPDRKTRRFAGTPDPIDAAARAVLAGRATRHPEDPHRPGGGHPGTAGGLQQRRRRAAPRPHPGRRP